MAVTTTTKAPAESLVITLVGANTFISGEGRQYKKGENYLLSTPDALKLLAAKDDYEVRYFIKVEGAEAEGVTQEAELVPENPLPTTEEIAADINDPLPSESSAEQGEIDTAATSARAKGKKAAVQVPV